MNLKYLSYLEPVYGSFLLSYFINILNDKGDKALLEMHLYKFFVFLKIKWRDNPFLVFFESIEKARPTLIIAFKQKISRNKKTILIVPTQINLNKQYKNVIK
jgi:ribosomal protein S7